MTLRYYRIQQPCETVLFFTRFTGLGTLGYRAGVWQRQWWLSVAPHPTLLHRHVVSGEGFGKEEGRKLSQKRQQRSQRASPEGLRRGRHEERGPAWTLAVSLRKNRLCCLKDSPRCPKHRKGTQLSCGSTTSILQAAPPYGMAACYLGLTSPLDGKTQEHAPCFKVPEWMAFLRFLSVRGSDVSSAA